MIIPNKIWPQFFVLCLTFCFNTEVLAVETQLSNFKLNGFGTVGLTKNSDQDLGYREMVSQQGIFDEYDWGQNSNLGIQANYYASEKLDFALQLLAIKRSENSLNKSIQWAYVNYKISPKLDLRLGRVGVGSFLMSDYRHVGFARLWTHLPTEFYGLRPVNGVDGIDLKYKQPLFDGLFSTNMWYGQANYDFYTQDVSEVHLKQLFGASIGWENDIWNVRFTYNQAQTQITNNSIKPLEQALQKASFSGWPLAGDYADLTIDNKMVRYYAAGVSYDKNDWLVQSELSVVHTDSKLTSGTMSSYLSVGRKLGSVTPFISGSWVKSLDDRLIMPTAPSGSYALLQNVSQYVFNQFYAGQHTGSVGARWDVQPKVALKFQWDKTWVDEYGSLLLDTPHGAIAEKRQLDVFSASIDFIF